MALVHCRDCGFDNPEEERFCQACNSDLYHQDVMSGNVMGRQTRRYQLLKEAADKTLSGEWTLEQLSEFLSNANASLQERAQSLLDNINEYDYEKESPEEVSTGLEGVRGYEEGVHEMWLYTQDRDPKHLEAGLATIWDGNQKVLTAMRLNRETRQAMLEELSRLHDEL